MVSQLENLEEILASRVERTFIPKVAYEVPGVKSIICSHNRIAVLPSELLEAVGEIQQKLTTLDLNHNMISVLPTSLPELRHLRSLVLSYNILSRLPQSLSQLEKLQVRKRKNEKRWRVKRKALKDGKVYRDLNFTCVLYDKVDFF